MSTLFGRGGENPRKTYKQVKETSKEKETNIQIVKIFVRIAQQIRFDEGDGFGQPRKPFLEFCRRAGVAFFGTNCNKFEFCRNNLHTRSSNVSVCV